MASRYKQLTVEERRKIERWRHAKVSVNDMARVLNRHRSTIFRELRRNHFEDTDLPGVVGYFGIAAQTETDKRRSKQRKLILYPDLCNLVESRN